MANNIIKRIWNQNTLVNIEALKGAIFQDEDGGHTFEISGVDNSGNAISLSGTVAGVFLRPDNTDVPITGSASGGIVSVTLPAECYDVPGRFGLTVFVTADSKKTCVYAAIGTVGRTSSGSVAPGTSADVVDLINQISAAVATIPASWSGLMADIAPTYSTSAAYPVGAYVYYNGDLYRCTTAITTGETWTAAHWTTAVLGNDVSDLKNAINEISEPYGVNIFNPYALLKNKAINTTTGDVANSSQYDLTEFIDVQDTDKITFKLFSYTGSPKFYVCYYSTNDASGFIRRVSNSSYISGRTMLFDTGTKYIRIVVDNSNNTTGTVDPFSVVVEKGEQTISSYVPYFTALDRIAREKIDALPEKYIWKSSASGYASCDDVAETCWFFISSTGGVLQIPDAPMRGWLQTYNVNANIAFQMLYPYDTTNNILYRQKIAGSWSAWVNINHNTWLMPVDTDTADETGKTDMTNAIMSMLTSTGYCHLAPGIYYVSGNIDMPAHSVLEGCGNKTIIRLLQSTTSGYIVRMHTYSTVKNIRFSGSHDALTIEQISSGNVGNRKGIAYIGNRDNTDSTITPKTTNCCMVEGCKFEFLDSGFYGHNAGGGIQEGVIFNDCYIYRCMVGINIDYWTEYCKFTNVITFQCGTACINNGGNNVFTACTFHGVVGFLIDNTSGDKPNTAHGTVNGCTFNHIDNMNNPDTLGNGYAIKVINITNGFVFSNCQLWYGKIYVENSSGVQFVGCEIGGRNSDNYKITTSGSYNVFFNGCLFQDAPSMSLQSPTKWDACYTYAGSAVTA